MVLAVGRRAAVVGLGAALLLTACESDAPTSRTATRPATAPSSTASGLADPSSAARAGQLPLALSTADAQQVITVTAHSLTTPVATLRTWNRERRSWVAVGPEVHANLGRMGLSRHETESLAATPVGSFTLTQAFGRDPNPGTRLPFFQTTPDDWWVSEPGPLYNTHQNCVTRCPFRTGTPNAQLYYVTPQYDLAVAIDYNRGPVQQGAGSGIFLHVSADRPTNGCVSIPLGQLVRIMRWLQPRLHPRILIGVG